MTLYRFTFNRGSYDVGQAVVLADTFEDAKIKLAEACSDYRIAEKQGISSYYTWRMEDVVWEDPEPTPTFPQSPLTVYSDVVFTWGVDG